MSATKKWDDVRKAMVTARKKKDQEYNAVKKARTKELKLLADIADSELDGRSTYNRNRKKRLSAS